MSTVLINPDMLTVLRPTEEKDSHGWATGSTRELIGRWRGTLQWSSPAPYDPERGPFDPSMQRVGTAYLPADAAVREGDVIVSERVPDPPVVARSVRLSLDPRGTGELDCWEVMVEEYVTGGDDV